MASTAIRSTLRLALAALACVAFADPASARSSPQASEVLEGQIVCSQCWFEADRNRVPYGTAGDLECAARCAGTGVPPALAVRTGDRFELRPLAGGPPEGGTDWLGWIGRYVRIEGRIGPGPEKAVHATSVEQLAAAPWAGPAEDAPPEAPRLAWTDLRGRPIDLGRFHGRIVVVNFWATWCRPCLDEIPDLLRVRDAYAPYGVELLGASADEPAAHDAVIEFVRRHKLGFTIALGATTAQMEQLGLPPVLPGTVVIDEAGRVIERFAGVVDEQRLAAVLSRLVEPVTVAETAEPPPIAAARPSHASLVPS